MRSAYKEHYQFILILIIMYVTGVWAGPIIYAMFPIVMLMFGLKFRYFELFIVAIWLLILADYVPVENATHDDLQFAKDLKPLVPLLLFGFFLRDREDFKPYSTLFLFFIPFILVVSAGLMDSINFTVGLQKTVSFILILVTVPMYVLKCHREDGELFWLSLMTFLIGMLAIGIVLRFVAPDIALLKGGRFKGILGNPNGLGVFLNLVFMLWIIIKEYKLAEFSVRANRLIFIVIIISLLWCESRNGMMSILLFYLVHRIVKVNWFLAVVVIAFFIGFNDQIFEVIIAIVEFFGFEDYFRVETIEEGSGRKIAWIFAWSQIQDYFFIGGGFGHDEHIMRANYYWLSRAGHQGGVHNSYLSMWFDAGIIGLVAYFGGLVTLVIKVMKHNYIAIAFLTSLLFNITYESWLVASLNPFTIIYFTILTILIGNLSLPKAEEEIHENE